jgi:hypothetical protein
MVDWASAGALIITLMLAITYSKSDASQLMAVICSCVHYSRRWFESHYLTRFTDERPTALVSFGCITYYWGFFGLVVMYSTLTRGEDFV